MPERTCAIIRVGWPAMLLTVMIFAVSEVGAASKGTISGTVTDAATGSPVPNATLIISELRRGIITGATGEFLIRDVPPGIYTIRTRRVGYAPSEDTLTMTEGEGTILTIRLFAEPIPMETMEVKAPRTVRQRVDDASEDAEAYAYREGRSRAPISREDEEWLSLAARAIREGQYELARSYAAEIGYEVERYREPDLDREYVVLQEKEEGDKGWGMFLYYPDYRFVDVIVQRITPDFTGAAVQKIASSVFEELGARALLICNAETSGWGSDTSPFKCVLDEWSDEKTLLVQLVGVYVRQNPVMMRLPDGGRLRRPPYEGVWTRVRLTDNRFHPPGQKALLPELVWEALRSFRKKGFSVPTFENLPGTTPSDSTYVRTPPPGEHPRSLTERQIARPWAGFAGAYARRVGLKEQQSYTFWMYQVDIPSFGVVIEGEALRNTAIGLLHARGIKDNLTEFLIQHVLSGLRMDQIAEASGLFRRSRPKLSAHEALEMVKLLVNVKKLAGDVRQTIIEDLLYAGAVSVPSLMQALIEAKHNPPAQEYAMDILAGIGAPAVESLIGLLGSKDEDVRRRAIWILRRIGDDRAGFALMALLRDRDPEIRKEAILGLGTAQSRESVPVLLEHLPRADMEARRAIAWSLGEIGDAQALEPLRALLEDPDGVLRRGTAESLTKIAGNDLQHIDMLLEGTRSEDPLVRAEFATALGRGQDIATVDPLLSLTRDGSADVRHAAAQALGDLGDTRAAPALVGLLDDGRGKVRMSAALALGDLRATDAVPDLIEVLGDPDDQVRMVTARALGEIGDTRAVPALITSLDAPDRKVRIEAIFALGKLRDLRGTGPLLSLLTEGETRIRREAVSALEEILKEHPENVDILIQLLDSADASLRKKALDALQGIQDPRIVEPLMRTLEDKDPEARRKATEALSVTRDTRAVGSLLTRLYDRSLIVRVEIIRALGEIGDVRAADPLLELLQRTARSFEPEQTETDSLLCEETVAALHRLFDANRTDAKVLAQALGARDRTIRRKAAALLRHSYRPEAVDALIDALGDEDWYVRREVALTLPRFQDVRAVSPLMGLLKDDKVQVRRAAAWALGELSAEKARETLVNALQDDDWGVRKEAAVSLGKLGDPDTMEFLEPLRDDPRREVREAAEWALTRLAS